MAQSRNTQHGAPSALPLAGRKAEAYHPPSGRRLLGAEDYGMDVVAWLRGLGLEQYEQAFRENDVDAEVLPELTAEDLIGLGVVSIGHRRKLLAAITALRGGPTLSRDEADRIRQDHSSSTALRARKDAKL